MSGGDDSPVARPGVNTLERAKPLQAGRFFLFSLNWRASQSELGASLQDAYRAQTEVKERDSVACVSSVMRQRPPLPLNVILKLEKLGRRRGPSVFRHAARLPRLPRSGGRVVERGAGEVSTAVHCVHAR